MGDVMDGYVLSPAFVHPLRYRTYRSGVTTGLVSSLVTHGYPQGASMHCCLWMWMAPSGTRWSVHYFVLVGV